MTRDEAQKHLLRYRPGTGDVLEPEIGEALSTAAQDAELAKWLEHHCDQQKVLREKFRSIAVPPGLKEQILSERPSIAQRLSLQNPIMMAGALAVLLLMIWGGFLFWNKTSSDDAFANYRARMVSTALRGYGMDFETSDAAKIRGYLAQQKVIENYELPNGLKRAATIGCAIEHWQGAKAAMICFKTGRPLQSGEESDLWLFVVNRSDVKGAPANQSPQFQKVNKLLTATWVRGDKLYVLGMEGDEQALRSWL